MEDYIQKKIGLIKDIPIIYANECLLMVGGKIMSNKMWTSTQSTQFTYSWYYDINIQGDHLDTGSRGSSRYVRPFTELIL